MATSTGKIVSGHIENTSSGAVIVYDFFAVQSGDADSVSAAFGTTVDVYGIMGVGSGGTAFGTVINSGGYEEIEAGGTDVGATVYAGGDQVVGDPNLVHVGGVASGATLSGGAQQIFLGGIAI